MAKLKKIPFLVSFTATLYVDAEDHSFAEYQLDARDKSILAMSSVCSITTTCYGHAYDPIIEDCSALISYNRMMGAGFVVNVHTGHIVTSRLENLMSMLSQKRFPKLMVRLDKLGRAMVLQALIKIG